MIKRWMMEFDHLVGPLVKQLEQLRTMLSNDMPKAAAYLAQVLKTLEAYANVAPSAASVAAPAGDATEIAGDEPGKQNSAAPPETLS